MVGCLLAAPKLNEGKKVCKKCFCYLLTGPVAPLTHSVSTSLQLTNEAAGKDVMSSWIHWILLWIDYQSPSAVDWGDIIGKLLCADNDLL